MTGPQKTHLIGLHELLDFLCCRAVERFEALLRALRQTLEQVVAQYNRVFVGLQAHVSVTRNEPSRGRTRWKLIKEGSSSGVVGRCCDSGA